MRLLLDTHVLLWWLADDPSLPSEHRRLISDTRNDGVVSSVTIAEIGIKASLGKLEVPDDLLSATQEFDELAFTAEHAVELRKLPWHHRDPFDRMLICQARVEKLTFLTTDAACRAYDVETR